MVRKLTNNTGQYSLWVILMLMIVLVMLAVASLGFFSSPASAQAESDCPAGTLPITTV